MADYETTNVDIDGAVALVSINRPDAMNSFDTQLRAELGASLRQVANDDSVRAIVLTGIGRSFSAGADLKGVRDPDKTIEQVLLEEYRQSFDVITATPKPVISAVSGSAAGIGMSLALVCDLCVMGEKSFLLSPFANISLVPDGGSTWLLTKQLGYKLAFQLAVECERIPAARCLDLGLINRVVADDEVLDNALEWAKSLAAKAPLGLAATKRAMRAAMSSSYDDAFRLEASLQSACLESDDFKEGVSAFLEKRTPEFKGR